MSSKSGIVRKGDRVYMVVKESATNGELINADKLLDHLEQGYVMSVITPGFRTGSIHYILEKPDLGAPIPPQQGNIENVIMEQMPDGAQDGSFHIFPRS